jgi:hypothetical protein
MRGNKKPTASNSDAVFIGWQETLTGSAFALYIVTAAGHPPYGSSVSEKTLNNLNLEIPKQQSSRGKERRFDSEKM